MEYIILGLLIAIVIMLLIIILRKNTNKEIDEKINKLEISMIKEIGEFKTDFSHSLTTDFNN